MALETPLGGRFLKENRILFFGPPPWYMQLMWATVAAGSAMVVFGLFQIVMRGENAAYFGWVGFMLLFAGFWALVTPRSSRAWFRWAALPRPMKCPA